jgi:ribosomal protein S18 acetylase RimI-like enzyme
MSKPEAGGPITVRPAQQADLRAIEACIEAALAPYARRIGKPPAPMLADHRAAIAAGRVHVLIEGAEVAGVLVRDDRDDCLFVDVLAVLPSRHRSGIGRHLMRFAEAGARSKGLDTVALYTHERMVEALSFYRALGYVETGRRVEDGYARVYLRKSVAP